MENIPIELRPGNNSQVETPPLWLVIHYADKPSRKRWGPWAEELIDQLTRFHWVVYRDGNQVECRHRSMLEH